MAKPILTKIPTATALLGGLLTHHEQRRTEREREAYRTAAKLALGDPQLRPPEGAAADECRKVQQARLDLESLLCGKKTYEDVMGLKPVIKHRTQMRDVIDIVAAVPPEQAETIARVYSKLHEPDQGWTIWLSARPSWTGKLLQQHLPAAIKQHARSLAEETPWERALQMLRVFRVRFARRQLREHLVRAKLGDPHHDRKCSVALERLDREGRTAEILKDLWEKHSNEMAEIGLPRPAGGERPETLEDYRPVDYLQHNHGIAANRLSEALRAGKVRAVRAPKGWIDSQGHAVRMLYHVEDAKRECGLKKRKTRRK